MKNSKKKYARPQLAEYGDIAEITGVLGNAFTGDVLVDTSGNVEQEGNLSIDACPTRDHQTCMINP